MDTVDVNLNTFGKIHSSPIFHHYHWCNSCEHYLEIPITVHVDKTLFSQVAVSNIGKQSSEMIETLENVEKNSKVVAIKQTSLPTFLPVQLYIVQYMYICPNECIGG